MYHRDSFVFMRGMPDDAVDVAILDPPYSERQHAGVRSSRRNRGLKVGNGRMSACATKRVVDLGFAHFTRPDCQRMCHELARLVKRWSLVFCDDDLLPIWRATARKAGLEVVRTGVWHRVGGAPQFTGDRPASGAEYIVILHRPGRKRWNGGGHSAHWSYPIVANRSGHRTYRIHTTQKTVALLMELVWLFSDPGEVVFDPTAGSGTTGVAAIRQGRRFVGIERDATYYGTCRERLAAEDLGLDLHAARAKQMSIMEIVNAND